MLLALFAAALTACGGGSSDESGDAGVLGTQETPPPDPVLVKALDISVYSGEIAAANVESWLSLGYTHVIVGTQKASTAKQQLATAVAGGMSVDVYVFLYFTSSMTTQVQNALSIAGGFPVGRIWLDIEADPGSLGVAGITDKIQEAIDACGTMPYGIYTGAWWWNQHMSGSAQFSDAPLWYAWYDDVASLDTWKTQAFGGWSSPAGKQYKGTTTVGGVGVDKNVMWLHVPDSGPALPPGVPSAPTGLSPDGATVTASSTTLTWSNVGATKYQILMQVGSPGAWKYYWTWTTGNASFTVWPQTPGKQYRWRVRGQNAAGWGAWSSWAGFYFP
ncbi:MAG: hypothetical protein HYY17_09925 [Planctomycetes bacterium]|nr:hypothetical protein [Planctomycetota bacterium]